MSLRIAVFIYCLLFLVSPGYGQGIHHQITGSGVITHQINGGSTSFTVLVTNGSGFITTNNGGQNGGAVGYGLTGQGSVMAAVGAQATVTETGYSATIIEPGGYARYGYSNSGTAQFYLSSDEGNGSLVVTHDPNAGVWADNRAWGQAHVVGKGIFYTSAENTNDSFNFRISGSSADFTSTNIDGQIPGLIEVTIEGNNIDYRGGFKVNLGPGVTEEAGFDFDFENRDPAMIRGDI